MSNLPRFREPMCGWPHDARRKDCGCVLVGARWHLCPEHMAELGNDLREIES